MKTREAWYDDRNSRSLRYAERVLPPERPILLRLPEKGCAAYSNQVSIIVAANLLSRMTPSLAFDVPVVDIAAPLPWAGRQLADHLREVALEADPLGSFEVRGARDGDYILTIGSSSSSATVHGAGWSAFVGTGPSPLPDIATPNPIGPALAAVLAVARLFALEMKPMDGPHLVNAFNWRDTPYDDLLNLGGIGDLGSIYTVGVGSVGTAALYFLTLATQRFSAGLFDMDVVKIHNLDRSPIYSAHDARNQLMKVHATASYLRSVGVQNVVSEAKALDESELWSQREGGTPDILIAAANERGVRSLIERSAPPLQIYGTTGENWQATVLRHIPFVDPCSCCLFPPAVQHASTLCASAEMASPANGEMIDAALPFLSFAAGLMAASEILKAGFLGYPFSANRITFQTHVEVLPRFHAHAIPRRPGCLCLNRKESVHRAMIEGSKYAGLSKHSHAA